MTFSPRTLRKMSNNAGFFPVTHTLLCQFAEVYLDAVAQLDAVGIWFNPGEDQVLRTRCPRSVVMPLRSIEPYYHHLPWSAQLRGKRVLVVHPFAETILRNYSSRRDLLFPDRDVLPPFSIEVMPAVQSIAGSSPPFKDWFDALDAMKTEVARREFDVCLIGAGAYGLPLAAFVKSLNRTAIHLGGATQILFGIRGHRWDSNPDVARLYNDSWCRPSAAERPDGYLRVERGAYW